MKSMLLIDKSKSLRRLFNTNYKDFIFILKICSHILNFSFLPLHTARYLHDYA